MSGKIALATIATAIALNGLPAQGQAQERVTAELKNADGKSVGTAELRETQSGVLMVLRAGALPPGLHAVHLHAAGECAAPGFASAGPHFNPLDRKHGLTNSEGPHAGDLPDIYANKDGAARYEVLLESVTLRPGQLSIFDCGAKSNVVHAAADDNLTDPSGNSGDRIAGGVITRARAKSE